MDAQKLEAHWNELQDLAHRGKLSPDKRLDLLLAIGREAFNLDMGIISRIEGNQYTVKHCSDPSVTGQVFNLGDTYCHITLKHKDLLAIKEMRISDFLRHPCYEVFKLETYVGIPIWVNGKLYGTVNFTKAEAREQGFNTQEMLFMRILGEAISATLELAEVLAKTEA